MCSSLLILDAVRTRNCNMDSGWLPNSHHCKYCQHQSVSDLVAHSRPCENTCARCLKQSHKSAPNLPELAARQGFRAKKFQRPGFKTLIRTRRVRMFHSMLELMTQSSQAQTLRLEVCQGSLCGLLAGPRPSPNPRRHFLNFAQGYPLLLGDLQNGRQIDLGKGLVGLYARSRHLAVCTEDLLQRRRRIRSHEAGKGDDVQLEASIHPELEEVLGGIVFGPFLGFPQRTKT